ncbi:MAG TPA: twin-arginine translocase TatA/TatE family subunit [Polyangiaceae bacterium]|nr:twin-arginine translocase TatA/TatE family subunit [Polyangiaceae bacterium]
MFGLSFSELIVIGVVTLVAVGPQKLPGMLHTMGRWLKKLRQMTTEVRAQTGIDEILRAEGIHGGLSELRQLTRGGAPAPAQSYQDPYANLEIDATREYPPEGVDSYGAMPDDLLDEPAEAQAPLAAEIKAS